MPSTIVAHLAPDLDCIAAIWIFKRFGGLHDVNLQFVPAGTTLNNQPGIVIRRLCMLTPAMGVLTIINVMYAR